MTRKNVLGRPHSSAGISENLRRKRRVFGKTEQKGGGKEEASTVTEYQRACL